MGRRKHPVVAWAEYTALRGLCGSLQCLSLGQNLQIADWVGWLFFHSNRGRRLRSEDNIRQSFPEWSPTRISATALVSMQHMFRVFMVESMLTARLITSATWSRHLRVGDIGPAMDLLIRGKPMILVTGHCGNWEILGQALAAIGYPVIALARPLDNPLLNDWLMGIREARGTRIVTKWGATTVLQDAIKAGGRIAFIADQNAGDMGIFVPFFGRLASSYKSIGILAMRYNVPIAVGHAMRVGSEVEYQVSCLDLIQPHEWADQPDPLFYITARFNRGLEQAVRIAPEQYVWVHRRWKSRPRHEREGKPMPARMINRLKQLPWLSGDELARIVDRSNAAAREAAESGAGASARSAQTDGGAAEDAFDGDGSHDGLAAE